MGEQEWYVLDTETRWRQKLRTRIQLSSPVGGYLCFQAADLSPCGSLDLCQ
jgi:hypothetical protein